METKENYSELEKKVIAAGFAEFREKLEGASQPLFEVLKNYGFAYKYGNILPKISLCCNDNEYYKKALSIPNDSQLLELAPLFLERFLIKINELKKTVDNLPI